LFFSPSLQLGGAGNFAERLKSPTRLEGKELAEEKENGLPSSSLFLLPSSCLPQPSHQCGWDELARERGKVRRAYWDPPVGFPGSVTALVGAFPAVDSSAGVSRAVTRVSVLHRNANCIMHKIHVDF
jgi:hypothetical protein